MLSNDKNSIKTTSFANKVYKVVEKIPKGYVSTYLDISIILKSSPRAVGQALKRNPFAPIIPCHRIVSNNLDIGGFQGAKNKNSKEINKKRKMLLEEGVLFDKPYRVII